MKERLITLGGAILAIYAIYLLLLPKPQPEFEPLSLPTTEDRGENGLAVVYQWLDQSGFRTFRLRDRFSALYAVPELPQQGNLLVISLPLRVDSRDWEDQQLQNWINEGNNILLLANLNDADNSGAVTFRQNFQFMSLFGFSFEIIDHEAPAEKDSAAPSARDIAAQQKYSLAPVADIAVTRNIDSIGVTNRHLYEHYWTLVSQETLRSFQPILYDPKTDSPAMWLGRSGNGKIFISRYSHLFSNAALAQQDNAKLLLNIMQHTLADNGYIIFDDMHQGLSELYDPDAFFSDERLHHTLWFIFVLWVIYVLGHTNRLQPVKEYPTRMRLVDNVRGIAHFVSRRLHRSAVARRMFFHFFNELRRYLGMPRNGEPVWDELKYYSQINQDELLKIKHYYDQARRQQAVNLVRLGQLINTIRKKLL